MAALEKTEPTRLFENLNTLSICRKGGKVREKMAVMQILKKILGYGGEVTADAMIIGLVSKIWSFLKQIHENLPESAKKKIPVFLGLNLNDEQIVNGLIRTLKKKDTNFEETKEPDIEKQEILFKFLYEKFKDFERNRFINVVAGMEVLEGKPGETETRWDNKTGNMLFEKKKESVPPIDRRKEFLDSFGEVLLSYGANLDTAYNDCVGGRMIIQDPFHQKVLRNFSESVKWFHDTILAPTKSSSLKELGEKIGNGFSKNTAYWQKKSSDFAANQKAKYEAAKAKKSKK